MATYELKADPDEDEVTVILRMTKAEFEDLIATGHEEDAKGNLDGLTDLYERIGLTKKVLQ